MHTFVPWTRRLLIALIALTALAVLAVPVPAAQATEPTPTPQPTLTEWPGWALRVTFPQDPATGLRAPKVTYIVYTFVEDSPPRVISAVEEDISASCTSYGTWNYNGDYAIFDGSNYIECDIPAWRDKLAQILPASPCAILNACQCLAGSPASGAANVRLASGNRANPLIDASELGMLFGLPRSGGQARTRLAVYPNVYISPQWNVATAGNRMLFGINGPILVALDNHFKWMPYLNSAWKPWFTNNVIGAEIGHYVEPSGATWQGGAGGYDLQTTAGTVYIGRNVAGSEYFRGQLADGKIDPGCKGG
jgi:hypothetical protein